MIKKAEEFARKAHEGQERKAGGSYIVHPLEVANILIDAGCSIEVACAGFLHDVIEDTNYTKEDILREFNENILNLVLSNTEDKTKSWFERKAHTHHSLVFSSLDERCLLVADKLSNLSSLIIEKKVHGEINWEKFKYGYKEQKWYFEGIANSCLIGLTEEEERLVPSFIYNYKLLCKEFFETNFFYS